MDPKALTAELIGTFTLVLAVAGATAVAGPNGGGIVAAALAYGLTMLAVLFVWGPVSGAHVNPAVTFGLALGGRVRWATAAGYWVAQCLGAVLASYLLAWLIGADVAMGASTGTLTAAQPLKVLVFEAVMTYFLVATVYGTSVAGDGRHAAGLAVGSVLAADVLLGGTVTGASMNPARTLGPALVLRDFSYLWIYVLGPLGGAALAALTFGLQRAGSRGPAGTRPPAGV
jgi:MIP family channel proteins